MNSSYSGIYQISQRNVLEVKLKRLVSSFVLLVMGKVQKLESVSGGWKVEKDHKTRSKE